MMAESDFLIGGRFRNRAGWYTVLDKRGSEIWVEYEATGVRQWLSVGLQRRIMQNISQEEGSVCPYEADEANRRYFTTVGYLARTGFIEAIIPPKSKSGFDATYRRVKGVYPRPQQPGYYVHHEEDVDKWGIEMRLTLPSGVPVGLGALDFGGSYKTVVGPDPSRVRVNSNELCWRLLTLGFELGQDHPLAAVENSVPDRFKQDFRRGAEGGLAGA